VPEMPTRPFVPRRTPKSSRQLESAAEFRLSRPFVPGSVRSAGHLAGQFSDGFYAAEQRESLPGIDQFVAAPRAEDVVARQSLHEYASELADESDELPPVEHFLDPLPAVEAFAPDVEGALADASPEQHTSPAAGGADAGWVEDTWQHYDWSAAASLGDGPETEASNEWATTDWDTGAPVARAQGSSPADAIATALDQIARRIREGEFPVAGPEALADPATIAATLAALLGVRR
jgi:hypothetical protein